MKKSWNANTIKVIAILAMTIDHIAWLLFPGYPKEPLPLLMHILGRITCPIMCYFIAEGYHHTRDVKNIPAGCLPLPSCPTLPMFFPLQLSWTGGPLSPFITAKF